MDQPYILFVFPHLNEIAGTHIDSFRESLGIGYIRAYLASHGIISEQYIQYEPRTIPQIANEIVERKFPAVGFSCYDSTFYVCVLIANAIKAINPKIKIIFGGPSITLADETIMKDYHCIDICCRGESEETCNELLSRLQAGKPFADVAGISFRSDGKLVRTPDRILKYGAETDCALDVIPSPYLSGLMPTNQYVQENLSEFALISSRGCSHKCTFCTNTALRRHHVQYHSVERVIDEIKYISSIIKPTQKVVFYDDAFTLNMARAKTICRRIIEEKLNSIQFNCITRVDRVDEELFDLMAHAGFNYICFGLESSSVKVLNIIKKIRATPAIDNDYGPELKFLETMKKNICLAKAKGMMSSVSIILGLPGETVKEARETLAFVDTLQVETYVHNYFKIIYGTESFFTCAKYGIRGKKHPLPLHYWMEYAYDVFAILPLKNSIFHRLEAARNKTYIQRLLIFFGIRHKIDFANIHVMIDQSAKDLAVVFAWLAPIIQLSSSLYIVEKDWEFSSMETILHSCVENSVPIYSYQRLKKQVNTISSDNDVQNITYSKKNLVGAFVDDKRYALNDVAHFNCHIFPFHTGVKQRFDNENDITIKTLGSLDDIKQLLKWVETTELSLSQAELPDYNFEIVDKCRWQAQSCSACHLEKLIISEDLKVLPCYSGQPVCRVGDDFSALKGKMEQISNAAEKRRNCHACPVKMHCAKCVFPPSFLSESEYCRIMRASPQIHIAVELPSLIHSLFQQKRSAAEQLKHIDISWFSSRVLIGNIFRDHSLSFYSWQLLKVQWHDECYLYHTGKAAFTSLSAALRESWRLIVSAGGDREEMFELIINQPGVNLEYAKDNVDVLLKLCEELIDQNYKAAFNLLFAS